MSTFNFSGAISGLDTAAMITAIMNAEKLPLTRLQASRTALKAKQTSYGDVRSLLAKLESASKAFTKDSAGAKRAAASSNAAVLSATASTTADAASYNVTVVRLATATRATSTAALGQAITAAANLGSTLASLNLPGTITAGQVGMIVDGKVVRATIDDPATETLGTALTKIGAALTAQVRANEGTGSTATVTAAIVDNRIRLSLSGTTQEHNLSLGVGGDTSNALGMLGLTGTGTVRLSSTAAMTGRSALGVTKTSVALASAGLAEAVSGSGTLTINGTAVAYDTATDSLSTLIGRINASSAGVVVSMDRANDKLVVTSKAGGAAQMALEDSGNLLAALNLDTADAQVVGQQAQVTVDDRTYFSDTNKLSTAIGGVTLTLLAEGTSTVSVTPDETGLTTSLKDFVSAFNALADKLDTLTANVSGTTPGVLASDSDVRTMTISLRRTLLGSTAVTGMFNTLAQIGLSTGAVGAAKGTTNRLQLDETKLKDALAQDPNAVASLLNSAAGAIKPFQDAVASWTKTGGRVDKALESIASSVRLMDTREEQMQARLDDREAALARKFATMEASLAKMQSQSGALSQQVNSMNNAG